MSKDQNVSKKSGASNASKVGNKEGIEKPETLENPEKPRKLRKEEIDDIINILPDIKSAADTVTKYNTDSMKKLFREQLSLIIITPLGIGDLKEEILRQFKESLIAPGTMIGVLASDSYSKNITQSALNSFQSSGSSKNVTSGIQRITELINATKNPQKTSANIYFKKDDISFNEVLTNQRPQFTEITIFDLLASVPDVFNKKEFIEPEWYSTYKIFYGEIPSSEEILHIELDINILYAYKVNIKQIVDVLESDGSMICVYSPLNLAEIYVYPVENVILNELSKNNIQISDNPELIFLTMIVIPNLKNTKISGITGIKEIYPAKAQVMSIVKDSLFQDGNWYLLLNPYRMKAIGVTSKKLAKLCSAVGLKVIKIRETYLALESDSEPIAFLNSRISEDKKISDEKYKTRSRNIEFKISDISRHSQLVYAECTGSNLKELLSNPNVDSTRTICNDVIEIYESFGIEAARTFLIKEFSDYFGEAGYINPRHIALLADFMTSLGKVYGVTFGGVSRQPIGSFEKASMEKAMDTFIEAGGFGEINSASGTSSSIFVGKQANIGSGFSPNYIPERNLDRYNKLRKEFLEDVDLSIDINNFKNAIQDFDIGSGDSIALLHGDDSEMFGRELEKGVANTFPINPISSINSVSSVSQSTKKSVITQSLSSVTPSSISSISLISSLISSPVIRSSVLQIAADELEDEMFAVCSNTTNTPNTNEEVTVTVESANIVTAKFILPSVSVSTAAINTQSKLPLIQNKQVIQPKAQAKIFNLDDFLA